MVWTCFVIQLKLSLCSFVDIVDFLILPVSTGFPLLFASRRLLVFHGLEMKKIA